MVQLRLVAPLLILGSVLLFAGRWIVTLDRGSCPLILTNSTKYACYHTFPGTNIYITPLGNLVTFVGLVILLLAGAIFVGNSFRQFKLVMVNVGGNLA